MSTIDVNHAQLIAISAMHEELALSVQQITFGKPMQTQITQEPTVRVLEHARSVKWLQIVMVVLDASHVNTSMNARNVKQTDTTWTILPFNV
jgi:hypothetical protein